MKAKWYTWAGIVFFVLLLLVSLVIFFKTPTYERALAAKYGGLYVPCFDAESDWQKFVERYIGECERFDKPSAICIKSDELTDAEVRRIDSTFGFGEMCLEGTRLTDETLESMANHKSLDNLTVASNRLTDDSFAYAGKRPPILLDLTLVSDSITGAKLSDLSPSRLRELRIKSDNLNHSLISQSSFPETLDTLVLVGPPLELEDYMNYADNLPQGCRLYVSPPLPDISSLQDSAGKISLRIAKWDPAKNGTCNCSDVPFDK